MSYLTFCLKRASVHPWHSPGSVVAPGRLSAPRWRPQGLFGKPMPAAGETAHVRRLLVVRSRCGLEVSPAPPGGIRSPPVYGRRPVVAIRPRTSQQADVGSKTRSAGRVLLQPLTPAGSRD